MQTALSQMNRMLQGSSGWTEGIPLWPRSILNASLWGSWWTDAGYGESPHYVIMLAECEVPCGPGGTHHLVLPLCVCMCVMERQSDTEGEARERKMGACCHFRCLHLQIGQDFNLKSTFHRKPQRRNVQIWRAYSGIKLQSDDHTDCSFGCYSTTAEEEECNEMMSLQQFQSKLKRWETAQKHDGNMEFLFVSCTNVRKVTVSSRLHTDLMFSCLQWKPQRTLKSLASCTSGVIC